MRCLKTGRYAMTLNQNCKTGPHRNLGPITLKLWTTPENRDYVNHLQIDCTLIRPHSIDYSFL